MSGIRPSDNGSSHTNKVTPRRPRLVLRVWDVLPFTGIQPQYVTNHRLTQPPTLSGKGN